MTTLVLERVDQTLMPYLVARFSLGARKLVEHMFYAAFVVVTLQDISAYSFCPRGITSTFLISSFTFNSMYYVQWNDI